MKKGIFVLLLACFICQLSIVSAQAYATFQKLDEIGLKKWLATNKIKVLTTDQGASWKFLIRCPPHSVKELQWGMSVIITGKQTDLANVSVKPRTITKSERSQLVGWLAFEITLSKDLAEESKILMYIEQKMPPHPSSGRPHQYTWIKLKHLAAMHSKDTEE